MEKINSFLEILSNTHDFKMLPKDYLEILEKEIDSYILEIMKFKTEEESDKVIIQLGGYQEKLAKLSFKYNVPLSEKLNLIVKYLDRADDLDSRKYFFLLVKNRTIR